METRLILGGPGCGKTTRLLKIITDEINDGLSNKKIAFVAFTTAAANEAKERAAKLFGFNVKKDLPHFRTIHSLCYRECSVQREEVMSWRDWKAFGAVVGYQISGGTSRGDDAETIGTGDRMLQVVELARTRQVTLREQWELTDGSTDWYALERFSGALEEFKKENSRLDFTDMLLEYLRMGEPIDVVAAVIDEAQDLTPLQWAVVRRAFANVERLYIGGDDDQAIYEWAGADVHQFLSIEADSRETLPTSHRLPANIHAYSTGIAERISRRFIKRFDTTGREGTIAYYHRVDQVDIQAREGTWLMLARNAYLLEPLRDYVRRLGLLYSDRKGPSIKPEHLRAMIGWRELQAGAPVKPDVANAILKLRYLPQWRSSSIKRVPPGAMYTSPELGIVGVMEPWYEGLQGIFAVDRAYYLACQRRGISLKDPPRIRIETIHAVKGAEADHVLVVSDMSERTQAGMNTHADAEHRVFYVAVTRAKQSLHIIEPQSTRSYPL